MKKRGAVGFSAPLIVVAIGVLILVYLYFLPVNDKCNLIPGLAVCGEGAAPNLVSITPGNLVPQEVSKRYSIPNVELFRLESLDIATLFDQIDVKRGWFFSDEKDATFSAPEGAKDAQLFFVVNDAKGSLNIIVNGNTIARTSGDGVKQVSIPLSILKSTNQLRLEPSVPWMPWSTNFQSISKVILRESYTKTTNKFSYSVELAQDVNEIQQGILDFNSQCFSDDNLSVTLNGQKIAEDKICNGLHLDVKKYLKMNNTIDLMTDGNYFIKDAYIDVSVKENNWPTYYFDVSSSRLESSKLIMLLLNLEGNGNKALSVYINGVSISAETNKMTWQTTINKFLVEGQNSIMFIPKTEVTISSAEVQ